MRHESRGVSRCVPKCNAGVLEKGQSTNSHWTMIASYITCLPSSICLARPVKAAAEANLDDIWVGEASEVGSVSWKLFCHAMSIQVTVAATRESCTTSRPPVR